MVLAIIINLVADIGDERAVLALRALGMALLTLLACLDDPVVEALVLEDLLVSLDAVRTFATGRVLAKVFKARGLCVFFGDAKTVDTLLVRAVSAQALLVLFICHWFLGVHRLDHLTGWLLGCVNHLFVLFPIFSFFFGLDCFLHRFCGFGSFFHRCKLNVLVADVQHVTIFETDLRQGDCACCLDRLG